MPSVLRNTAVNIVTLSDVVSISLQDIEKGTEWSKWTHASVNKHFLDRIKEIPIYLEGDERTYQDEAEFAELRIDGPFVMQPSKGFYILNLEINILIQTHMNPTKLYRKQSLIGLFTKAFSNSICAFKYGDGPLDDGTKFGVYRLHNTLPNFIEINDYGIIKEDTRLTQTTIEGHYRLEVTNP